MGITGLIPLVKPYSRIVNIKTYSGCKAAVDVYCWLHKGAIACADKLFEGEDSDRYVNYCMKYIDMLLSNNIVPILVFDGRPFPAKADTERFRKERRKKNKLKAAQLMSQNRLQEAYNAMKASIDITHAMAFKLIKRSRQMGIDCIVAPYEADAQLAYLNITGLADIVITEDSDLLLFGCKKVLFKLDLAGNGLFVEQSMLPLAMNLHSDRFSMEKFRHMCILSGCDYLDSLPGMSLGQARKFINNTVDMNISRALTKLLARLNMANGSGIPLDYVDKFLAADSVFKYQPVFDPKQRKVVTLNPTAEGRRGSLQSLSDEISFQLALGNLDPITLKIIDDWNPDSLHEMKFIPSVSSRATNSIWSKANSTFPRYTNNSKPTEVAESSNARKRGVEYNKQGLADDTTIESAEVKKLRLFDPDRNPCQEIDSQEKGSTIERRVKAFSAGAGRITETKYFHKRPELNTVQNYIVQESAQSGKTFCSSRKNDSQRSGVEERFLPDKSRQFASNMVDRERTNRISRFKFIKMETVPPQFAKDDSKIHEPVKIKNKSDEGSIIFVKARSSSAPASEFERQAVSQKNFMPYCSLFARISNHKNKLPAEILFTKNNVINSTEHRNPTSARESEPHTSFLKTKNFNTLKHADKSKKSPRVNNELLFWQQKFENVKLTSRQKNLLLYRPPFLSAANGITEKFMDNTRFNAQTRSY